MTQTKFLFGLCVGVGVLTLAQAEEIPAGTNIPVRTNETINVHGSPDRRVYTGVVQSDVLDRDGRVAIARGSSVELMVRDIGNHTLALDLDSVTVNGKRYSVESSEVTRTGHEKEGVGANARTGKFVGGGALFGTIVGAIAGGGKGAAIGALAGGAAGATGQMATRGGRVRVPAESLVTFRLEQPLHIVPEAGYYRNGVHYHH